MRGIATRILLTIAAALAAAGCDKHGQVYDRPQSEVRELLRTVEVPLYMFGSTAETMATVDASDPAAIAWKITADEASLMTFVATIQPEDGGKSRVIIRVEGSRQGKFGDIQARLDKMNEVRALYLASMTEAVDSTLDGRRYDITATYPALIAAGAANAHLMVPPSDSDDGPSNSGTHR